MPDKDIEAWVSAHDAPVAAILEAAREAIKGEVPGTVEWINGWKMLAFGPRPKMNACQFVLDARGRPRQPRVRRRCCPGRPERPARGDRQVAAPSQAAPALRPGPARGARPDQGGGRGRAQLAAGGSQGMMMVEPSLAAPGVLEVPVEGGPPGRGRSRRARAIRHRRHRPGAPPVSRCVPRPRSRRGSWVPTRAGQHWAPPNRSPR